MNGYILSIVGVVVVGVIIDVVLPSGSTSKYIKSIMALIVVFVIVAPLPGLASKLQKGGLNLDVSGSSDLIDKNFVYSVNQQKVEVLKNQAAAALEAEGIKNMQIFISGDLFEADLKITLVSVSLAGVVNPPGTKDAELKDKIATVIKKYFNVEKEAVNFYGR